MSTDLIVPKAGFAMAEAEVMEWCVGDGADVEAGDCVCRLEADKATLEIEAPASGRIKIKSDVGDTVKIGSVIATID